jgi:hypothetical protein
MTEIPGLDSRRYSKYSSVSDETKARYKGFEKIKEYEHFYLCGRYTDDGKLLYKECFSKFDVDGVKVMHKSREPYTQWWRG